MKYLFSILTTTILSVNFSFATDYYLYYLGGQSNMDGYGYTKDLPDTLNKIYKDVMIFHGNTMPDDTIVDGRGIWAPLQYGHGVGFKSDGKTNKYSDRFGLELSFANQLLKSKPNAKIAIIKYSRGGTAIDVAAQDNYGCWDPDYKGTNGINQYDHFLATVRNALSIKDIDGDGTPDRLIPSGILWMQGESDGYDDKQVAERYLSNLKRLMDIMRAAFLTDDLPVVIGLISDSGQDKDGKFWNYGTTIQEAQRYFVKIDANAALVNSTLNYSYSDAAHYDSKGYIDLGLKFAEAVLLLKQVNK